MGKLQIMDTTIRDGQQSLWATRMPIGDMLPILPKMDRVGYWAIEAWGGATFDTCLRFLDENPWDRLRSIKAKTPNTRLSMLDRTWLATSIIPRRSFTVSSLLRIATASMCSACSTR